MALTIGIAEVDFLMQLALLHLRCYHFFEEHGSTSKKEGLMKGYLVATAIAEKAHNAQAESDFFSYAPDLHYSAVALSAMFILKITRSAYSQELDVAEARKAFNFCHVIIRKTIIENNDLRGRTTKILSQLWNSDASGEQQHEPSLKIRTRLSGCLLHDLMWQWRERFGNEKSRRPSPNAARFTRDSTQSDVMHHRSRGNGDITSGRNLTGDVTDKSSHPSQTLTGSTLPNLSTVHTDSLSALAGCHPQVSSANVVGPPVDPDLDIDLMPMPTGYVGSYWDTMLDDLFSEDTFQ